MTNLAEVAQLEEPEKTAAEEIAFLKSVIRDLNKRLEATNSNTAADTFFLQGVILRQRTQLRNQSESLWRKRQANRKVQAQLQEVFDRVPAAAKWRDERRQEQKDWHESRG